MPVMRLQDTMHGRIEPQHLDFMINLLENKPSRHPQLTRDPESLSQRRSPALKTRTKTSLPEIAHAHRMDGQRILITCATSGLGFKDGKHFPR